MKGLQIKKALTQGISGDSYGKLFIKDVAHILHRPFNAIRTEVESIFSDAERTTMKKEGLKTYEDREAFSRYTILAEYLFNAIIRFDASIYDAEIAMLKVYTILHHENLAEIIKLNSIVCILKNDPVKSGCNLLNIEKGLQAKAPYEDELLLNQLEIFINSLKRCFAIEKTFEIIAERIGIPDIKGLLYKVPFVWVDAINEYIQGLSTFPNNSVYSLLCESGYKYIGLETLKPNTKKVADLKQAIINLDYFNQTAKVEEFFL